MRKTFYDQENAGRENYQKFSYDQENAGRENYQSFITTIYIYGDEKEKVKTHMSRS